MIRDEENIQNEFISTISHEIRTPLTSIKGFTQTMLDNWENLDTAQKRKFLTIINEQSQRLINLVENVLNVAKIEGTGGGSGELILKEVDLERIVKKTLDLIKVNFKDHNFVVHPFEKPSNSLCDYDCLQQILVNIIENSCKYSPKNSTIEISFSTVNDFNLISIKDKGFGIKHENLDKIFEKFFRADNFLTSKTQGSGLGLYIAQKLAKKMGGKIEVESVYLPYDEINGKGQNPNHYSKFTIYLPVFEIEKMTKFLHTGAKSDRKHPEIYKDGHNV